MYEIQRYDGTESKLWLRVIQSESLSDCLDVAKHYSIAGTRVRVLSLANRMCLGYFSRGYALPYDSIAKQP